MKKNRLLFVLLILFSVSFTGIKFVDALEQTIQRGQTYTIPKKNWQKSNSTVVCDTSGLSASSVKETSSSYTFTFAEGEANAVVKCTETSGGTASEYDVDLKYNNSATMTIKGSQTSELDSNGNILKTFPFIKKVISASIVDGAEYIDLDCNAGSACTVKASSAAYDDREHTAVVKIKYSDETGKEYEIDINIEIEVTGSVRAYPGGYQTCPFDSGQWKENPRGTYSNNTYWYQAKVSGNVTLPSCGGGEIQDSSGVPIVFAGWVKTSVSLTVQKQGTCSSGSLGAFVPAGSSVKGDAGGNYHSCYEYVPMVRVSISGVEFTDTSWIKTRTAFENVESGIYYKTAASVDAKINLPSAATGEFSDVTDKEITSWVNGLTGESVAPGTAVPADGSIYYAMYGMVVTGSEKSIFAGMSDVITVYGHTVTGCSSDNNSILQASFINGECIITGIEASGASTVKVTVDFEEQSQPAEYIFTVYPDYGGYGETAIIQPYIQDEGVFGEETGKNGITVGQEYCDVYKAGHNGDFYKVSCDGKTYVALCLDPGTSAPPEGGDYQLDSSASAIPQIRAMTKRMRAESKNFSTSDPTAMKALNSIFRVAFIAVGYSYYSGSEAYQGFAADANVLKGGNWQAVASKHCGTMQWCSNIVQEYVTLESLKGADFELVRRVTTSDVTDNGYTLNYEGEIKVPKGVNTVTGADGSGCSSFTGAQCSMDIGESYVDPDTNQTVYKFSATIVVPDARTVRVPITDDEKRQASFKLCPGNVPEEAFVTTNAQGGATQRLLVPPEETECFYVYLSPAPATCLTLAATNIETCESGSSECNKKLFIETGCCSLINDEFGHPNLSILCSNRSCITNTLGQVCDFIPNGSHNGEASQIYHIREGVVGNTEQLNECVVNATQDYSLDAMKGNQGSGLSSDYNVDQGSFVKYDAAGNKLNSSAYSGNRYCQVTCKEDWDFSLGAFGNYMGAEAVTAGSYFQINKSDIFIKGVRTCYTTKLQPAKYVNDMRELAKQLIEAYNTYSDNGHSLAAHWIEGEEDAYKDKENFTYWKDSTTGYGADSGSTTVCSHYNDVQIDTYAWKDLYTDPQDQADCEADNGPENCGSYSEYQGSRTETDQCTETTSFVEKTGGPADETWSDPKDNEFVVPHLGNITISNKYNDGVVAAGSYEKWDPSKVAGTTENGSATAYNKYESTVSCTATPTGSGASRRDEVTCTGSQGESVLALKNTDYGTKDYGNAKKYIDESLIGKPSIKNVKDDNTKDRAGADFLYRQYAEQVKQKAKAAMDGGASTMKSVAAEMQQLANQWFSCENFVVYTSNYSDEQFPDIGDMGALGGKLGPTKVGTEFNPIVTYSYDERNYMNILSQEYNELIKQNGANMLVLNDAKNGYSVDDKGHIHGAAIGSSKGATITITDSSGAVSTYSDTIDVSVKGKEYYTAGSVYEGSGAIANPQNYTGAGGNENVNIDQPLTLCWVGTHKNISGDAIKNAGVNPYGPMNGAWTKAWEATFRGGGPDDTNGHCYTVKLEYREYNYAKMSVSNSAFYLNKGFWYSSATSNIAHGDNAIEAIKNLNKITGTSFATDDTELERWARLGSFNVFPVAMTTPRNLYQYTYLFANIGSYLDGKAGRLMGDDDSVFQNNTRTCFYEVIETICYCCGDPVEYHTVDTKGIEPSIRDAYADTYQMKGKTSNRDKVKDSKSGSMGFYNTVSSLTSLSALNESGGERTLAANWGSDSIFNYNGYNRYVTNKGEIAAKAIEAIGEDIYGDSSRPEYAYRLTPDAISTIKQDNLSNSYGVNFKKMNTYGVTLIVPEGGQYQVADMAEKINFAHYGSQFLEGTMQQFKMDKSLDLASYSGNSAVCTVTEDEVNGTGAGIASKLTSKVHSGCRWIDYIEKTGSNPNGGDSNGPFRLAFK